MAKVVKKCSTCGGTGWVRVPATIINNEGERVERQDLPTIKICPTCKGEGSKEVEEDEPTAE
jgi:DnaJ-class molecular chaperone